MKPETTRDINHITSRCIWMAMELSQKEWKPGFTIGLGQWPRVRDLNN